MSRRRFRIRPGPAFRVGAFAEWRAERQGRRPGVSRPASACNEVRRFAFAAEEIATDGAGSATREGAPSIGVACGC